MIEIQLKYKSFDSSSIKFTTNSIEYFLEILKKTYKSRTFPSKIKKITILRSPHIDKSSREQFQMKTYKKSFSLSFNDFQEASVFLYLLKNSQFIGIELEICVLFLDYFYEYEKE